MSSNLSNNDQQSDEHALRSKYGVATEIVKNMLKEIKDRNRDEQMLQIINECCDVADGQEAYIEKCTFPETELQVKIAEDTNRDDKAGQTISMLSGKAEGNLLKMMAEMQQAKHILEIGMFTGYSTVVLAESAFCEEVVTLEIDPYYEQFVKSRLAGTDLQNKIRIMVGHAKDSLVQLKSEEKEFDFVFIDANKGGYLKYYQYIMDNKLLKSTGTIVCDNILWYGRTFNQSDAIGKVLNEFVDFVKNDVRVNQVILPIRDGILIIKPTL